MLRITEYSALRMIQGGNISKGIFCDVDAPLSLSGGGRCTIKEVVF